MAHIGNGEHDFDNLEASKILNEETKGRIKQARIEARDIINRLEPVHINGWPDLLTKLDDCRDVAFRNAKLLDPAFRERWGKKKIIEEKAEELRQKKLDNYSNITLVLWFAWLAVGIFTSLPLKIGWVLWLILMVVCPVIITFAVMTVDVYLGVRREYQPLQAKLRQLLKEGG